MHVLRVVLNSLDKSVQKVCLVKLNICDSKFTLLF